LSYNHGLKAVVIADVKAVVIADLKAVVIAGNLTKTSFNHGF
jgi:hypothetical protein